MAQVHMPWIAKNADDQVGKIIQALKANGDWSSTLVIVLADHGATSAKSAHYVDAAGGGNRAGPRPEQHLRQYHLRPAGR